MASIATSPSLAGDLLVLPVRMVISVIGFPGSRA